MPEVVQPRGGEPVTLRPCPPWCTLDEHFAGQDVIDTDDGYHHYGPEIEVPTADRMSADDPGTVVRVTLKSWTHPLDAGPGPARVELNLGTAEKGTDMCADLTPAEAEDIARALLDLAATARHGPA